MGCLICGDAKTIKSHLIPRAMAREVQIGKAHAVTNGSNDFKHTQSGLFEKMILCEPCDGKLGELENIAIKAFREIRSKAKLLPNGSYNLAGFTGNEILRFIAGLLWKYSVASPDNGRIDLGSYQDKLRNIAFSNANIPEYFDAMLFRLKLHHGDDGVFAYRAPILDKQEGVNGYRILVGGVFIFAKVDKQSPKKGALALNSIRDKLVLPYVVLPAQDFEEYSIPSKMVHSGRLSDFLDKQ